MSDTTPPQLRTLAPGLYRIERPARREQGYLVRLSARGQQRRRFFSDARYDDALAVATAYRDQVVAELAQLAAEPRPARSNTGIVGVTLSTDRKGIRIANAIWVDRTGKQRRATARIDRWGEDQAIRIVLRKRLEGMRR
jgi:hypothetical protein